MNNQKSSVHRHNCMEPGRSWSLHNETSEVIGRLTAAFSSQTLYSEALYRGCKITWPYIPDENVTADEIRAIGLSCGTRSSIAVCMEEENRERARRFMAQDDPRFARNLMQMSRDVSPSGQENYSFNLAGTILLFLNNNRPVWDTVTLQNRWTLEITRKLLQKARRSGVEFVQGWREPSFTQNFWQI